MSPNEELSVDDRMSRLERKAKVVQSRLLRAVDALDARRHQVTEIGHQAKKLAVPAALSVLGMAALVGVGALSIGFVLRSRRRRSLSSRFSHAIRRMDLVHQPSLGKRIFDKVALSLVTFAATEVAKHVMKNVADGRLLDGRLAVGNALHQHHKELTGPAPMLLEGGPVR
jgi:hypothetical protein